MHRVTAAAPAEYRGPAAPTTGRFEQCVIVSFAVGRFAEVPGLSTVRAAPAQQCESDDVHNVNYDVTPTRHLEFIASQTKLASKSREPLEEAARVVDSSVESTRDVNARNRTRNCRVRQCTENTCIEDITQYNDTDTNQQPLIHRTSRTLLWRIQQIWNKRTQSSSTNFSPNTIGDGFANQSYSMVHLLTLLPRNVNTATEFFDNRCVIFQMYNCGLYVRQTSTNECFDT